MAAAADQQKQPNILLIVADDLGWGDVGWHGGLARTPHMDKLVKAGVELDQHYVQPVCTPTRTALLSGRYPGRFGPHALAPSNLRAMPLGTETLASALKSLDVHAPPLPGVQPTTLPRLWARSSRNVRSHRLAALAALVRPSGSPRAVRRK